MTSARPEDEWGWAGCLDHACRHHSHLRLCLLAPLVLLSPAPPPLGSPPRQPCTPPQLPPPPAVHPSLGPPRGPHRTFTTSAPPAPLHRGCARHAAPHRWGGTSGSLIHHHTPPSITHTLRPSVTHPPQRNPHPHLYILPPHPTCIIFVCTYGPSLSALGVVSFTFSFLFIYTGD